MAKIPVIFLAFANDRVDTASYLRNLPKELHGIRGSLEIAVKEKLCEVVERANATIDTILDVFQDSRYRDRIAIFHYGGHANGYQLLLENLDGSHASAHSEGLVSFLAKQIGLQLVFLNGCSSQQQALDLVKAGIAAVIGTSQSINDDVATMLSIRFYQALGNGASIDRAWAEAVDQVKIQKGTANMRDLFWGDGQEEDTAQPDRFPWDIYYKHGADLVKGWNLPESADNPLFGLPDLSVTFDIPEQPYRFLQRYNRLHAPIFFGRSYAIRDLYNNTIDPVAAPIILFFGQSGVGKSSMLDAGVFPRLEQTRQVIYLRRMEHKGLLGTLKHGLGFEDGGRSLRNTQHEKDASAIRLQIKQLEQITANADEGLAASVQGVIDQLRARLEALLEETAHDDTYLEASSLKEFWLMMERQNHSPLVVLLDQVEEIYTRPNTHLKDELEVFLDEIKEIFGDISTRPKGKLILSYRKEFHPEIKEACTMRGLPKEEIFLKALTRKDIIEVVKGLTLTERVRRTYKLQVEAELPVIIADDLLEDKDSPIAPVLQILLTKMWKMTEHEEHRHFSVERYQKLKKDGILMGDFFNEQMALLEKEFPTEVASGLALGLLQLHVTTMGTAGTVKESEIEALYADRLPMVEKLIEKLKDLYILASAGNESTGLAHDTLAPLVMREVRHSDKPAQRASIILDNKAVAFTKDRNNLIDSEDLHIVEAGVYGMTLWNDVEKALVSESRKRRDKRIAAKKRIRQLGIVASILIFLTAVFAFEQMFEAKAKAEEALKAQQQAEEAKHRAENAQHEAEDAQQQAAKDRDKAAKAEDYALAQKDSAEIAYKNAEIEKANAVKAGQEAIKSAIAAENSRKQAQLAKDMAVFESMQAKLAKLEADSTAKIASKERTRAEYQLMLTNARQVAIQSTLIENNRTLKALLAMKAHDLEKEAQKKQTKGMSAQQMNEIFESMDRALLAFDSDNLYPGESWSFEVRGSNILLSGQRGKLFDGILTDNTEGKLPRLSTQEIAANIGQEKIYHTAIKANNESILALGNGRIVKLAGSQVAEYYQHAGLLGFAYFAAQGWVCSSASDNTVIVWSEKEQKVKWKLQSKAPINHLAADPARQWLFGGDAEGRLWRWNLQAIDPTPELIGKAGDEPLRSIAYNATLHWLIAGSASGAIYGIDVLQGGEATAFANKHLGQVSEIAFSSNRQFLATASFDGQILLWNIADGMSINTLVARPPAVIQNRQKILALNFSEDSKYLMFSDLTALRVRIVDNELLYRQLAANTKGEVLTTAQKNMYVGTDAD